MVSLLIFTLYKFLLWKGELKRNSGGKKKKETVKFGHNHEDLGFY